MINYTFKTWKEQRRLDEVQGNILNPYLHVDQKEGDFIWFGVHDLFKMYKTSGSVPQDISLNEIMPKMGVIKDIDSKGSRVKVAIKKPMASMGYRNIKTHEKNGDFHAFIPVANLSDFTSLLGANAEQSGDKLWLASMNKYQMQKMRALKKAEMEQQQGQQQDQMAQDSLGQMFQQKGQIDHAPIPTLAQLTGEPEEQSQQHPQTAPLAKFAPNANDTDEFLKRIKRTNGIQVAHFDPLNVGCLFQLGESSRYERVSSL